MPRPLKFSLSVWGSRRNMGRLHSNLRMTKVSGMLFSLNHHKSEKGYMVVKLKSQTELHVEGKKFHFSMYIDGWASFSWVEAKCQMDEKNKGNISVQWAWPGKGNGEYRMCLLGVASEKKISLYAGTFKKDDSHPDLSQTDQFVAIFPANSATFALKRFMVWMLNYMVTLFLSSFILSWMAFHYF